MSICDLVRNTCLEGSLVAKHVRIDDEAVAAFAKRLESVKIDRGETGLPLKFDNINEEINFHVLYAILQFGSGYRHKLHKITGRVWFILLNLGCSLCHSIWFDFNGSQ